VSFRIRRDPLLTYRANPLVFVTAAPHAPKIPWQRPELLGSTWDIENGREKTTSTADLFLATAAAALLLEGAGFCELPGAAGVKMIGTERVLELFRSRAGGGTSFIALALNLQSASQRQIGTA
jgi:hypothetical protein